MSSLFIVNLGRAKEPFDLESSGMNMDGLVISCLSELAGIPFVPTQTERLLTVLVRRST